MSGKKISLGIVMFLCVLIFAGCGKTDRYAEFSKEDQAFSWQGERERSFGDSDYSKIESESEAFDVIENKYKLGIPSYYQETKELLEKEIPSSTVKPGETVYSIFAKDNELEFKTTYSFHDEKELQVRAEVNLNYVLLKEQKEAYLKSQIISIMVAPVKGKLPNDNLTELVRSMSENMGLSDEVISNGLAEYEKQITETKSPIIDTFVPVVKNTDNLNIDNELTKMIGVKYDQDGEARQLYAEISDMR